MTTDKKVLKNIHAIFKWLATKKLGIRYSKENCMNYYSLRKKLKGEYHITVVGKCKLFYDSLVGKVESRKKKLDDFVSKMNAITVQANREDNFYESSTDFAGYEALDVGNMGAYELKQLMLGLQDTNCWYHSGIKCIMSDADDRPRVEDIAKNTGLLSRLHAAHEKRFGLLSDITKRELRAKSAVGIFHVRGCKQPSFV
jgi:hypothetical protein